MLQKTTTWRGNNLLEICFCIFCSLEKKAPPVKKAVSSPHRTIKVTFLKLIFSSRFYTSKKVVENATQETML